MSSTSSPASGDSASALSEQADSVPSPSARSTPTAEPCSASIGLPCPASRMCATCTPETLGQLTLFAGDSPARTSAQPGREPDSAAIVPASGASTAGSSGKSSRRGSSSKTSAPFALADWIKCSGKSLRSGMTRSGTVFALPTLAPHTYGTGYGSSPTHSIPTPTASDHIERRSTSKEVLNFETNKSVSLDRFVRRWPTPTSRDYKDGSAQSCANVPVNSLLGTAVHRKWPTPTANRRDGLQSHGVNAISGSLNPTWVEWLMGFPLGWTVLEPSETPSSRRSRKSSGGQSLKRKRSDD